MLSVKPSVDMTNLSAYLSDAIRERMLMEELDGEAAFCDRFCLLVNYWSIAEQVICLSFCENGRIDNLAQEKQEQILRN